jgi:hypothetical protein
MPWEKVSIDSLVNIKQENNVSVGNIISLLDKVLCLFNDMKSDSIKLEQSLLKLKETVESEGVVTDSSLSTYNSLMVQYFNTLRLYLSIKVPSESGLGRPLICPVTDIHVDPDTCLNVTSSFSYNIKLPEYSWVNCAKTCVIDNMSVPEACPCNSENLSIVIKIGCNTVSLPLKVLDQVTLDPPNPDIHDILTYTEFCDCLCTDVPDKLHLLIAHFNKNILLIEKCIGNINNLVTTYELLC